MQTLNSINLTDLDYLFLVYQTIYDSCPVQNKQANMHLDIGYSVSQKVWLILAMFSDFCKHNPLPKIGYHLWTAHYKKGRRFLPQRNFNYIRIHLMSLLTRNK